MPEVETPATPAPDTTPEPTPAETPADDFDKERALETIRKQRESESDALKRAKEAEAELKKIKDAQLSEQERTKQEAEDAKQAAQQATEALRDARITMGLANAASGKVKDPSIVRRLIDDNKVKIDDDGKVTNADELIEGLLKEHSYLAAEKKTDDRPTNLKQVLEGGEPVIEDGKPLEGEAARELFKRDPEKFNDMMDRGLIKGV